MPAAELVRAGVCSMGPEDRAKCRCCGPERSCWVAGRSPTRAHCGPLSLCGSIVDQDTSCALSWGGRDHTDGQILGQLRPLAEEEEEEEEGARAAPATGPAFPGMGSEELRLASFYDWPLSAVVRPEPLAAAGFFHTGEPWGPFWTSRRLLGSPGSSSPTAGGSVPDKAAGGTCPQPPSLSWLLRL